MKIHAAFLFIATVFVYGGCTPDQDDPFVDDCGGKAPGGLINLAITEEDDIKMGLSVVNEIESNPTEYPVMDSIQYKEAYGHIYRIRDMVLNSGKVYYRNKFPWRIRLIRDDNTLNAFCTPGGYIYVYTGIIKYLDNETQLAGVMGHEIAHADRRHSANQMLKQYGLTTLISILTGADPGLLEQLAINMLLLKYSRNDETEADDYSVRYLYPTEYDPRGAKFFFEKISASGGPSLPEFLSTHPNPDNRVANIEKMWSCLGSKTGGQLFESRYQQFKNSLP
ncbi:MAG: M48 family metalloprotease [Bacteroidota bacterium]|jgi:predicted Zn-dependent protease